MFQSSTFLVSAFHIMTIYNILQWQLFQVGHLTKHILIYVSFRDIFLERCFVMIRRFHESCHAETVIFMDHGISMRTVLPFANGNAVNIQ